MKPSDNNYGSLIVKLREKHNITQDTLANILLINTDMLNTVEKGQAQLTDSQLNMCSNIFDVSKFALENGEIRPRIKHAELQFNLDKLMEQYKEAVESQAFMLETIQELIPPQRYKAQYSDMKEYDIYGYFVFDTKEQDFVRDNNNKPIRYDTAKDALEAAKKMDAAYKKEDKDISVRDTAEKNVTESVTLDNDKSAEQEDKLNKENIISMDDNVEETSMKL